MPKGKNSTIISAYTALATVAIGVVAFDFTRRSDSGDQLTGWSTRAIAAVPLPKTAPAKPVAQARPQTARTVATYTPRTAL